MEKKSMDTKDEIQTFYAASLEEWRKWLDKNGRSEKSLWLIMDHKSSKTPGVHWHDAIENALYYGWVDSKAISSDKKI